MTTGSFLIDIVFSSICEWVGYVTIRILTMGRVKLDWGRGTESVMAEAIGIIVLLMIGIGAAAFAV